MKLRTQYQEKIDEYLENNNRVQKKLKALKKKLRDIIDLQIKKDNTPDLKLSSEQKDKLKKKGLVEQEIVDVEKELEILETQEPPPIPSNLLDIDMELINIQSPPDNSVIKAGNTNVDSKPGTKEEPKNGQIKDADKNKVEEAKPVTNPKENEIKVEKKSSKQVEKQVEEEEFVVVASTKKNRKR